MMIQNTITSWDVGTLRHMMIVLYACLLQELPVSCELQCGMWNVAKHPKVLTKKFNV